MGGEASRWTGALREHEGRNFYKDGAEGKVPERRYGRSMDATVTEAETEGGMKAGKREKRVPAAGVRELLFPAGVVDRSRFFI